MWAKINFSEIAQAKVHTKILGLDVVINNLVDIYLYL